MKNISNPTSKKKVNPLSEVHIQATCTAWLALDGWRCVRTDMPHLRGLGVSEPGMADNLYIRYCGGESKSYWPEAAALAVVRCDVMHIEWKKKGGKAAKHQRDWHAKERALGALTLIAGEDFPASIEGFCGWYVSSGLRRKRISLPQ